MRQKNNRPVGAGRQCNNETAETVVHLDGYLTTTDTVLQRPEIDEPKITNRQAAYLNQLITRVGNSHYRSVKARLGLSHLTALQLSKTQAGHLIRILRTERRRRR